MFKGIGARKEAKATRQEQEPWIERTAVVWKTALGCVVAWELARITGSKHPYLAPLTFILCLQVTIGQSLRFAAYRSVGTVIGVLMIGFFADNIPVTAWALGIALLVSTALMKVVGVKDQLIHQVALSILFVLYFENHSAGYAWDRAKDTLIGALVGVSFVTLLFPTNELRKAEQALETFVQHFVDAVEETAKAVHLNLLNPTPNSGGHVNGIAVSQRVNKLIDELLKITQALQKAQQGLPFNPYANRASAQLLIQRLDAVRKACMHFATLTETLTSIMTPDQREAWSHRLWCLAEDIRMFMSKNRMAPLPSTGVSHPTFDPKTVDSQAFNETVSKIELQIIMNAIRQPS